VRHLDRRAEEVIVPTDDDDRGLLDLGVVLAAVPVGDRAVAREVIAATGQHRAIDGLAEPGRLPVLGGLLHEAGLERLVDLLREQLVLRGIERFSLREVPQAVAPAPTSATAC